MRGPWFGGRPSLRDPEVSGHANEVVINWRQGYGHGVPVPPWHSPGQRRLYEKLIAKSLPGVPIRHLHVNTEGWQHIVFEVNREYVFRFPRSREHAKLLAVEARLLPELAARLPTKVPEPIVVGSLPGRRAWPFVAYRRIPGEPLDWDRLADAPRARLARELSPVLRALARFPVAKALHLGVPGGGPSRWKANHEAELGRFRTKGYPVFPKELREAVEAIFRRYLEDGRNFRWRPVLLHREVHAGHVLTAQGHVTGIIDWGYACVGDPARELAPWSAHFGSKELSVLAGGRRSADDETFFDRVVLYRTLIPVYHILGGLDIGDRRMVKSGLHYLRRALRQPSETGWT